MEQIIINIVMAALFQLCGMTIALAILLVFLVRVERSHARTNRFLKGGPEA